MDSGCRRDRGGCCGVVAVRRWKIPAACRASHHEGANIARVSRVNVEILQPTPHSLLLAEDETVAIVVKVTGGSFDEVTLETFTEKQGAARQSMKGRTEAEFTSNIHVMDETVEKTIFRS